MIYAIAMSPLDGIVAWAANGENFWWSWL